MREFEEIDVYAAFHLEAWTDETSSEVFHRACAVLRDAGIRVKAASARPEVSSLVGDALYG